MYNQLPESSSLGTVRWHFGVYIVSALFALTYLGAVIAISPGQAHATPNSVCSSSTTTTPHQIGG